MPAIGYLTLDTHCSHLIFEPDTRSGTRIVSCFGADHESRLVTAVAAIYPARSRDLSVSGHAGSSARDRERAVPRNALATFS